MRCLLSILSIYPLFVFSQYANNTFDSFNNAEGHGTILKLNDSAYVSTGFTSGGFGANGYNILLNDEGDSISSRIISKSNITIYVGMNAAAVQFNNRIISAGVFLDDLGVLPWRGGVVISNYNLDTLRTFSIGGSSDDRFWSVAITQDSNYVFAGETTSFSASSDMWLVKTDTIGSVLWQKNYGGGGTEATRSIDTTSDGGFIIAGHTNSFGTGGDNIYVVKTDADGNQQWHKWFGGPGNEVGWVKSLSDGSFLIYGGYSFENPENSSQIVRHGSVMLLDANGNQLWHKIYDNYTPGTFGYYNYTEGFEALTIVNDGYVFCGLSVDSTDNHPLGWIVKTDFNGNELWSRRYRKRTFSNYFRDLVETPDGGFMISGWVGPDISGNTQDVWIVRTNCLGFDQAPLANATAHFDDNYTIVLENNSHFFGDCMIDWGDGNSTSVTEFDDSLVSHTYSASGNYQIEIIANACNDADTFYLNVNPTALGFDEVDLQSGFKIYPNPASESVKLIFDETENVLVSIYDLSGKIIYSKQYNGLSNQIEIDISGFDAGTYFVHLNTVSENSGQKLLVIH